MSRYLRDQSFDTPEGPVTVSGGHVRFSLWDGSRAICALSIPAAEARDLADFLMEELSREPTGRALTNN